MVNWLHRLAGGTRSRGSGGRRVPGVEEGDAERLEIARVARDEGEAMHGGGGGDEGIGEVCAVT